MTSDELISALAGALETKAASDAALQVAFKRDEVVAALEMGAAIEGHIDFSPLREYLQTKGVSKEVVDQALTELGQTATDSGFALAEGLFHEPTAEDRVAAILEAAPRRVAPAVDGFLPAAEIQKERDNMDRALVSVVVKSETLADVVDLDKLRDQLGLALDGATSTGKLELEPLFAFLQSAGVQEADSQETILVLAQLGAPDYTGPGKTRYQIGLPASLAALAEPARKAILDKFNKRHPIEAPPVSRKAPPSAAKKDSKQASRVPGLPPKAKPPNKKLRAMMAAVAVVVIGVGAFLLMRKEPDFIAIDGTLQSPPNGMPCSQLLAQKKLVYCGVKAEAWRELAQRSASEINQMKDRTREAVQLAGYEKVNFGLHVRR